MVKQCGSLTVGFLTGFLHTQETLLFEETSPLSREIMHLKPMSTLPPTPLYKGASRMFPFSQQRGYLWRFVSGSLGKGFFFCKSQLLPIPEIGGISPPPPPKIRGFR